MYPAGGGRKCPKYWFRLDSEAAHVSWIVQAASSAGVLNGVICLHLDDMWGLAMNCLNRIRQNSINSLDSAQ